MQLYLNLNMLHIEHISILNATISLTFVLSPSHTHFSPTFTEISSFIQPLFNFIQFPVLPFLTLQFQVPLQRTNLQSNLFYHFDMKLVNGENNKELLLQTSNFFE